MDAKRAKVEEKRKEASATAFQKAVLGLRSGRRSVDEEPAALAAGLAAVQEAHEAQAAQRAHVEAQTQDAKVPEGGVNMAAVLAKERLGASPPDSASWQRLFGPWLCLVFA